MTVLREKVGDSISKKDVIKLRKQMARQRGKGLNPQHNRLIQFLYDVDSLQDSIKIKDIEVALKARLNNQNINVPFSIYKVVKSKQDKPAYNEVIIGFVSPMAYKIELGDTTSYLLRRIGSPMLLSLFIVGFTLFSFILLYKNLLDQKRLGNIKNEFISNITHELKTPIATVSVAIEALRNFNASLDPSRSKEYLDISANELQRLSLLVDKVLKLSMFEKKEVDLKYEALNMQDLIKEVTSSLRLQFEKNNAAVSIMAEVILRSRATAFTW
jgi:two-component system phosphate regulon sensor histidine kinase PhoR